MATNGDRAYELMRAALGQPEGSGDWIQIDQARIDAFAEVSGDHQFIHVDPEACRTMSPWGVPIAHGFLTLSLLTKLMESVPQPPKIRASSVLAAVDQKDPNTLQVTRTVTVEIDGESKPALVADWVTRAVYG